MQIFRSLAFLLLVSCLSIGCESAGDMVDPIEAETAPVRMDFGQNWEFRRLQDPSGADALWEEVVLPHSTRIEPLVVNDQWQGRAVYEKSFDIGFPENEHWFLEFEGVMQEAKVFVNDSLAKEHQGGYLPFQVNLSPYLLEGQENRIRVEVTNVDNAEIPPGKPLEELDFNYYGGIYRNVYLVKKGPVYITNPVAAEVVNSGGVLVHFENVSDSMATGLVKTHIRNGGQEPKTLQVNYSFTDSEGRNQQFESVKQELEAGEALSLSKKIEIRNPRLWSPERPHLYRLQVKVMADGEELDRQELRTGIREIRLTEDGFYLNGEELFLNGTNRHQEYPFVGYALSDEAQYRDAYKIKQAGFNLVRLSHYPQATAFLEACDELGLLVMNAIPGWQFFEEGKFEENALQDIRDMARRDRNHPSVVFWENSLNESGMTEKFMLRANAVLKEELPYPDTYSAGWIDHPSYDLFIPARQHAEPPSYWNNYEKEGRPLFIAEYGDWEYYAQNAGFNQKAFADLKEEERTSRQFRGSGEKALLQQALNFQEAFNSNLKGAQTIGHANWLMFDYNRGYSNDIEASGISDIFRLPKFAYYFYQSQKAPNILDTQEPETETKATTATTATKASTESLPMVFIASYWTPSSNPEVRVFSNTEEVALYLNDELIERKSPEPNQFSDALSFPPYHFNLGEFEEGKLRAVGFIDGQEVASHEVVTPGEPSQLKLEVDLSNKNISPHRADMVFIYAHVLDGNGNPVPTASHDIMFSLEGEPEHAELLGGDSVAAEAGIASILLRTTKFEEPLLIKASSRELGEAELEIKNP